MMKKSAVNLLKIISLLLIIFFIIVIFYLNSFIFFLKNNTCIYIHRNETFSEFNADVRRNTRHIFPLTLKIYSRLNHLDRHLEAGEYCFTQHDSIVSMMRKIKRNEREVHSFTLVDGWTYQEVIAHLSAAPALSNIAMLNDNNAVSAQLSLPMNGLEGQFYPETYFYAYPDTAIDVLRQAHDLMKQRLQALYQAPQARALFKNSYELLVAASIIQKEAGNPEDQRLVASVIVNRQKLHMRLQMDPTVIYGLGENFHASLTKKDLKQDSPYNTYLHMGLPPTPICMPGETALYAAAHPADSPYLYFVSKKNGYHQFSKTLAEQTEAINQYLLIK